MTAEVDIKKQELVSKENKVIVTFARNHPLPSNHSTSGKVQCNEQIGDNSRLRLVPGVACASSLLKEALDHKARVVNALCLTGAVWSSGHPRKDVPFHVGLEGGFAWWVLVWHRAFG